MQVDVFPHLTIGLAKLLEGERQYPYPAELQYALHHLSAAMLEDYPKTITQLLKLFEKPLDTWWPGKLPDGIDPRFELVYQGRLDEQVLEYLEGLEVPSGASLETTQAIQDNQLIVQILNKARNAYNVDPKQASEEYVAVRWFILTHPWTTPEQIHEELGHLRYFKPEEIGNLYQDARNLEPVLLSPSSTSARASYWNCPSCGPLYVQQHQLQSIKQSACTGRCPGLQGWTPVDPLTRPLVVKRGIHLRTYLPGVAERQLYRWLQEETQPGKVALVAVSLWPGVDRYDLQLRFSDGHIWAVDVKDYKDPYSLGQHIAQDTPYEVEAALRWQRGCYFYVFPSYREAWRPNYRQSVLQAAKQLPPGIQVMSEDLFKKRVTRKLEKGE